MSEPTRPELAAMLDRAEAELKRLCDGGNWTMRIPATTGDSDLIFGEVIEAARCQPPAPADAGANDGEPVTAELLRLADQKAENTLAYSKGREIEAVDSDGTRVGTTLILAKAYRHLRRLKSPPRPGGTPCPKCGGKGGWETGPNSETCKWCDGTGNAPADPRPEPAATATGDVEKLVRRSDAEVKRLANGGKWKMCIPVQPDDSDIIFSDVSTALEELVARAPVPDAVREALLAAKAFGSQGTTNEGISVSYLIDVALGLRPAACGEAK